MDLMDHWSMMIPYQNYEPSFYWQVYQTIHDRSPYENEYEEIWGIIMRNKYEEIWEIDMRNIYEEIWGMNMRKYISDHPCPLPTSLLCWKSFKVNLCSCVKPSHINSWFRFAREPGLCEKLLKYSERIRRRRKRECYICELIICKFVFDFVYSFKIRF